MHILYHSSLYKNQQFSLKQLAIPSNLKKCENLIMDVGIAHNIKEK